MWEHHTNTGVVRVLVSTRDDGDFNLDVVPPDVLESRRRSLVDLPWTMLAERHGTSVITVERPGDRDREVGDVVITTSPGAVLGAWVGDCAPVVLVSDDGVIAAVHAGWRGLAAGILEAAIGAFDSLGAGPLVAYLGPSIHGCCYEFGERDLAAVAAATGSPIDQIRAVTRWGTTSLDVPAVVRTMLARRGIGLGSVGACTGCDPSYFSHRMRSELQRHVVAVWKAAA